MEYKYGMNINYEDLSSGRVLYHTSGVTNFPVRLAQEIYGRCLEHSSKKEDICLYDCCCGGGYLLTVLGLLNQQSISYIYGSDINEKSIEVAKKNLSLLTTSGMGQRLIEIEDMINQYNKPSHMEAKESANRLFEMIRNKNIKTHIFVADALNNISIVKTPDIILVDVPYGDVVNWETNEDNAINKLLDSLYNICNEETVLGICMDKKQKITNNYFIRLEKQSIGKRKFEILKKFS